MALKVEQLNADTTFLLTFAPPFAPDTPDKPARRFPGEFTILIDPWLRGPSSILHPSFQLSRHTVEPAITSLKELQEYIDLIIISQDKPDHCHRETLCSLPRERKIHILATPAAARKIRSWNHFDESQIEALKPYNAAAAETVHCIPLPGYSSSSSGPGRVTIANVASKRDVTGLHNAVCITYQPPSSTFTLNTQHGRHETGSTVQLCATGISPPSTSPRPRTAHDRVPFEPLDWTSANRRDRPGKTPHPTNVRVDSGYASNTLNAEKTVSVIYTPHGLSSNLLTPYVDNHLAPLDALPVLALFHSVTAESNPWFMGGEVCLGAPGGVQLAQLLGGVRYWIGAHDEEKLNLGLATRWCKTRWYTVDDVQRLLRERRMLDTRVLQLGVGERIRLPILDGGRRRVYGGKNASLPNLSGPGQRRGEDGW